MRLTPASKQIQDVAVGHLHRVAGFRGQAFHALVDHRLVGLLGIDHREAQFLEKGSGRRA